MGIRWAKIGVMNLNERQGGNWQLAVTPYHYTSYLSLLLSILVLLSRLSPADHHVRVILRSAAAVHESVIESFASASTARLTTICTPTRQRIPGRGTRPVPDVGQQHTPHCSCVLSRSPGRMTSDSSQSTNRPLRTTRNFPSLPRSVVGWMSKFASLMSL